jgi:hypothetical protein
MRGVASSSWNIINIPLTPILNSKILFSKKMFALPTPASLKSSLDATKVEYVQLGSSGLRVSMPILGTMGIGSKAWGDWVIEEAEGLELLKAAWDRGKLGMWKYAKDLLLSQQ